MVDLARFTYPMVPIEPLPPAKGIVTQWRASRGITERKGNTKRSIGKARAAWSPSEAADLSGVSVRTVHDWKVEEVVEPSFTWPERNINQPRYCALDLLRLRIVADLGDAGYDRRLRELVSWSITETFGYYPERPYRLDEVLDSWDRWFFPADTTTAEMLQQEYLGVLVMVDKDNDPENELEIAEHPGLHLVEYPVSQRVAELQHRIGAWWLKVRYSEKDQPPWMR